MMRQNRNRMFASMEVRHWMVTTALIWLGMLIAQGSAATDPLPLPAVNLPDEPAYPPSVVTAQGQRLLLAHVAVELVWDAKAKRLGSSLNNAWLINYPLQRIKGLEGKSEDTIAELLFGRKRSELKNWYIYCPGKEPDKVPAPAGPAPIDHHPATLIVNARHSKANDSNPGTAAKPLKTISAALKRAKAGDVVHVYPAVYRESLKFDTGGTSPNPVRIEGIRDDSGNMPVISGNDRILPAQWQRVNGFKDVFRADIVTGMEGPLAIDGNLARERTMPGELAPFEYCFNRGGEEMIAPRIGPDEVENAPWKWKIQKADADGFLVVAEKNPDCVVYASVWVWVPPKQDGEIFDPRFPEPITGRLACEGPFRLYRMTGTPIGSQSNLFRLWLNGKLLPGPYTPGFPRANSDYGESEVWDNFVYQEGWNHLLFLFDTSGKEKNGILKFKMKVPEGVSGIISQANKPSDLSKPPAGVKPLPYLSKWKISPPFPTSPDRGVYLRLPAGKKPDAYTIDLAARNTLALLDKPFVEVRGLEFRHGAQFQQRAQLQVKAEGCLVEGCLFREPEVRAIGISSGGSLDQKKSPIVIRNNWILRPGSIGIGSAGSSDKLTDKNQNGDVPGRGRMVIEYNVIVDNNRSHYRRWWESGGMKHFRMSGAVIRNNRIVRGDGPGIWLDWEHFNNRLEGNIAVDGTAFVVGIEASPGPNLVANNIAVNLRPGGVWFRAGILSWSSHRTWAVFNTLDGRWNQEGGTWKGRTGTDGIYLHEGPANRNTRWGTLPEEHAVLNNIITGCPVAVDRAGWTKGSIAEGNVTETKAKDSPEFIVKVDQIPFLNVEELDYRLQPETSLPVKVSQHKITNYVRHDFYGLIRFSDFPAPGACRRDPLPVDPNVVRLEYELKDGTVKRLYPVRYNGEFIVSVQGQLRNLHQPAPYAGSQDGKGQATVLPGGRSFHLTGNRWQRFRLDYTVTPQTTLVCELTVKNPGEIIGVAFDEDLTHGNKKRVFHLTGSQTTPADMVHDEFKGWNSGTHRLVIPVGKYYTGAMKYLAFIADDDAKQAADVTFSNVAIVENEPPQLEWIAPVEDTVIPEGVDLQVEVAARDMDGTIANVRLYLDGTLIRQENRTPYQWNFPGQDDKLLQNLSPGTYKLTAVAKDNLGAASSIHTTLRVLSSAQTSAISVPGTVEAEDYRDGGQRIGHYDTTPGNTGKAYRNDDVDIQVADDSQGQPFNVGWIAVGEWLDYDLQIKSAGNYTIILRVASAHNASKTVQLYLDGRPLTAPVTFNTQGKGWQVYQNVKVTGVWLPAGLHALRIFARSASFNINFLRFQKE